LSAPSSRPAAPSLPVSVDCASSLLGSCLQTADMLRALAGDALLNNADVAVASHAQTTLAKLLTVDADTYGALGADVHTALCHALGAAAPL
jgi:hypothetical protein